MINLYVAIIAAVVNAILTLILPCLLNNSNLPILVKIRNAYNKRHESIIISSVIVALIVYISIELAPHLLNKDFQLFKN